jgi:hypothetical protein
MRRTAAFAAFLTLAATLAPAPGAQPAGQPAREGGAPGSTGAAAREGPSVRLLDAGAEPRRPLRLALAAGHRERATATMDMQMTMAMDGEQMDAPRVPTFELVYALEVTGPAQDGRFPVRGVIDAARTAPGQQVDAEMADAFGAMLTSLRGAVITGFVDDRGVYHGTRVEMPQQATAEMREQMAGLADSFSEASVTFPAEAVGVGARWEVTADLATDGGPTLRQTTVYTLESVNGEDVVLRAQATQTAPAQEMPANPKAPGVRLRVESAEGSMNGTMRLRLSRLMPLESRVEGSTTMRSVMDDGAGNATTMTQTMRTTATLRGE